ncbi:PAS domain S-box protein [candidate division KSB1 bacterium]|nr:PAS domain S-box protein [candidate division KSB1 bacterium]
MSSRFFSTHTQTLAAPLAPSDQQLRQIVEQLPAVMWTTDTELRFTSSMGSGLAALQLKPNATNGKSLFEYFQTADLNFLPIAKHRRALAGESCSYEQEWAGRAFQTHLEPLRDHDGRIIGTLGIALDVTTLKRTEAALRQARQEFDDLVNSLEGIVWEVDARTLRFTFVSKQAERLLGYPTELWLADPDFWRNHLPLEDRDWDLRFCLEAAAAKGRFEFEHRMLAADGRVIWMRNFITLEQEHGLPLKLRGVMVNFSENKRTVQELRNAQLELGEAYSQLAAIVELAPSVAIQGYDTNGVVKSWNRASDEMFGVAAAEALGKKLGALPLPPETAREFEALLQHVLATNTPAPMRELQTHAANGEARYILASLFPIRFGREQQQVICMGIDVTQRRRTEEALRMNQEHYRRLVESTKVVPFEAEAQTCRFTYIGPQAVKLFGYALEDWYCEHFWPEHLHPEDRERAMAICREASTHEADYDFQYRMLAADGRAVWVREIVSAMRNETGAITLHGFLLDITERKRAKYALLESQTRLKLLTSVATGITSGMSVEQILARTVKHISQHFPTLRVSYAAVNAHGLARVLHSHDPIGAHALVGAEVDLSAVPPCLETFRKHDPLIVDTIERDKRLAPLAALLDENHIRAVLYVPVHYAEQLVGILGFDAPEPRQWGEHEIATLCEIAEYLAVAIKEAHAQQERKRLEEERTAALNVANAELARAARLKDEFLASMSHELRTPLNAILGISEALREEVYGPVNDGQRTALNNIEESGRHLLSLINDILDLSRIEAGKLELEIDPFSVESVCAASLRFIQQMALHKGLNISAQYDPAVKIIHADERRLKQVLVNLLSNAVKFTPNGGTVGLKVVGEPQHEVVHFTVWDTGIGISVPDLLKLFQPFVQLDSSLSREYPGTGLGLVLVQRMVKLHGGGVSVESEPGRGSRFTVSLPWQKDAMDSALDDEAAALDPDGGRLPATLVAAPASATTAPLILLAEDNESNLRTLRDYLAGKRYRVILSREGNEAIARAREAMPDLVLMDIQMRGMSGLEAIRRMRSETGLRRIPIIALTALAMPGDRERCLEAGANDYLSKPVSLKKLLAMIETQLRASC